MVKALFLTSALASCLLAAAPAAGAATADAGAELRSAASRGDLARVKELLDAGTDVNAKSEYGATALSFAADKGHVKVIELLLARGAEVEPRDSFYDATPIGWAGYNGHAEAVRVLMEAGADPTSAVMMAIQRDKLEVVRLVATSGKVPLDSLSGALAMAKTAGKADIAQALEDAGVKPPPPATAEVDPAVLATYVGRYTGKDGMYLAVSLADEKTLQVRFMEQPVLVMGAVDATRFRPKAFEALTLTFRSAGGEVTGVTLDQAGTILEFAREASPPAPAAEPPGGGR